MKNKLVNSSRMPVYRDAGFELYDAETTAEAFRKETEHIREPDLYIYSRYRNPTVVAAENEIMKLEGSGWALLTQSGMSAIDTALSVFQKGSSTRPWLFFSEIYGGTISFIESVLKNRRGLDVHTFFPENERYDPDGFETAVKKVRPEVIYIESISNPMLIVPDAVEIIKIAGKYDAKVIVDNTFATPGLWKPLDSRADIVIHSATKYFSGHGNITAGVLCGNNNEIMQAALEYRKFVGHMLSPDDAYRLHTQIQSFDLRYNRQCSNASRLAESLARNERIGKVWFPGLESHATHHEAEKLFGGKGYGAMITFELQGANDDQKRIRRDRFIKSVSEKIKLIPSLGDPYTILMPVESVWGAKYPKPGMLRLSVGFEDFNELEENITEALKKND